MKRIMFVIPFAGGSSQSFAPWKDAEEFTFYYVDIPGKGKNRERPFLKSMEEMGKFCADDISSVLEKEDVKEYYLWGHSMGSYLSYEAIKVLVEQGSLLPSRLILSGTVGPERINRVEMRRHLGSDEKFLDYIIDFGLVSEKISKSRFFQSKFLPVIKNDYEALEKYHAKKVVIPGLRTMVINGEDDATVNYQDAIQWSEYFEEEILFKWVSGNHFFVLDGMRIVNDIIRDISHI